MVMKIAFFDISDEGKSAGRYAGSLTSSPLIAVLVSRFRSPSHWNADGIGTLAPYFQCPALSVRREVRRTERAGHEEA